MARHAAARTTPLELVGGWWNDTYEFWEELEIWKATPLQEDTAPEAMALAQQLDRVNATLMRVRGERLAASGSEAGAGDGDRRGQEELAVLLDPLPGLLAAYYGMRISRTLNKRVVKRGLTSSVLYANIGIAAVFFRVVAPRLLAAGTLDDLFDAGTAIGIPDRATLGSMLDAVQGYDTVSKIGLYTLAFVLEKLTMVSEFLPIQVGLKTLAPVLFGGLLPGAIGSAVCETLGALCNFAIGRLFLTTRLRELSFFGGPPLGEAKWFESLSRAAKEDGLRLVLLLRLAPVLPLPFDSYWYLLGALPVRPEQFALAHFVGCLKTAFLDASFGMLLLSSVSLESDEVKAQAQQVILLESAAFLLVALLIGSVATELANEMLGLDAEEEDGKADARGQPKEEELQQRPSPAAGVEVNPDNSSSSLLKGARRVD